MMEEREQEQQMGTPLLASGVLKSREHFVDEDTTNEKAQITQNEEVWQSWSINFFFDMIFFF